MKNIFTFFCLLTLSLSNAQTVINGTQVYTAPNAIVSIKSDSLLLENNAYFFQEGLLVVDKDFIVNSGKNEINGTVQIGENLVNNDTIIGLSSASIIQLNGNWTNNKYFVPGLNTTILNGNYQRIDGLISTNFFNLNALGSIVDKKELQNVDITVTNILDLTDVEFATKTNKISVLNSNSNAILRNEGFVSSEGVGRLERKTNSTQEYIFPLGSTNNSFRYRPISLIPNQNISQIYGARLVNNNPNNDSYNTSLVDDSICDANLEFYHKIYGNNSADVSVFYDEIEDGSWNTNAHWQNTQWNKMPNEISLNSNNFSVVKTKKWNNYTSENFVLALKKPFLYLDNIKDAYYSESVNLEALYIGPDPLNVSWNPSENMDCPTCLETELITYKNGFYTITVDATKNCSISDSIQLIVSPFDIQFPTAFSPNKDGVNDFFIPMNSSLETFDLKIFNRWGELIFETLDYKKGWNGVYKSQIAPIGVYTYNVSYTIKNQSKVKTKSGNLTLLR